MYKNIVISRSMRPRRIESVGCSNSARLTAAAAALQFSLRESRITSTIVGISEPERVEQTLRLAEWSIPDKLWNELEPLALVGKKRHSVRSAFSIEKGDALRACAEGFIRKLPRNSRFVLSGPPDASWLN